MEKSKKRDFVDIHDTVTNVMIEAIESGQFSEWKKTWATSKDFFNAKNATTKRRYRGINVLLAAIAMQKKGFSRNEWMTYEQAKQNGTPVRKGEKSTTIVFYKSIEREDEAGEKSTVFFAKGYAVFNIAQLEGYPDQVSDVEKVKFDPLEEAEKIVKNCAAQVREGNSDSAYFSPALDYIQMPSRIDFFNREGFYSTLMHELVHWTGHKDRLNREFGKRFGDQAYAAEELVAEIGSAMLCSYLGIVPETMENHINYVASWLQLLKSDKKAIFTAASQAQKAMDLLVPVLSEKQAEAEAA